MKLALLFAISENPSNPQITADGVIWATRVVTHLTKRMLYMSQFYVAEGKFDRLKSIPRVRRVAKRCLSGVRALAHLAKAGGSMDRTSLMRRLSVDTETFKKIINTLHLCDLIEEEYVERRKVIYSLKAA